MNSIGFLCKDIRKYITKDSNNNPLMIGIDIQKCVPTIIYNLYKLFYNNFDNISLIEYLENINNDIEYLKKKK